MRFTSLLGLACLTITTLAAPTQQAPKDLEPFEKAIQKVQASLKSLTTAIRDLDATGRRGGNNDKQEQEVERRAAEVTTSIRNGAASIRKAPTLNAVEATAIVAPIDELGAVTQRTVDAWIVAKGSIVRAGGRQAVLTLLAAQEVATDEFVDAVNGKMPLVTLTAARIYGQRARTQVDLAIAAFRAP